MRRLARLALKSKLIMRVALALLILLFALILISKPEKLGGENVQRAVQNPIIIDSSPSSNLVRRESIKLDSGMVGLASYYGDEFIGKNMACGGQFSQEKSNAAHRWFPCGSLVRVTSLANGRFTDVVINDKGPFIAGRIIDLSKRSFSEIAATSSGLVKVKLEILEE